ncbi:LAMI_0G02388g1_1 [Lachancea mirantina]|uniref:Maintenance of telomere capping protein 6 n=1 Tax=Lachancea mirantina TaxID=1230905 RepID=A0A1G4K7R6_9SACH|nr:LAMI_0G02388g1_1 [Lachancea mirantina]
MDVVLNILIGIFVYVGIVAGSFWPSVSYQSQVALRSQRDIMANVSIDQIPFVGIKVSTVFNSSWDNITQALQVLSGVLDAGIQTLVVDVSLEEQDNEISVMNTNMTLRDVLVTLETYMSSTNNYLDANILNLMLRTDERRNSQAVPDLNMTAYLEQSIPLSRIYMPQNLMEDRREGNAFDFEGNISSFGWPRMQNFLFEQQKRLMITAVDDDTDKVLNSSLIFDSNILTYLTDNSSVVCPLATQSALARTAQFQWRFLENEFNPKDIFEYVRCGFSPIITNEFDSPTLPGMDSLLESALLWSWQIGQPEEDESSKSNSTSLIAYRCAILHFQALNASSYWRTGNCYVSKDGLCRLLNKPFAWSLSTSESDYFELNDDDTDRKCPQNFDLSVPKSPLQQRAVEIYLSTLESPDMDIWIDLNSIAVPDCWVVGGPYASCPYEQNVSARNFLHMLAPSCVFAAVLLLMMIYLNWQKVPIQDNRKSWKRVVNSYSRSESEGVPA